MPLVHGGPPEWVWERPTGPLRWELVPSQDADGRTLYELRLSCGLEIVRLHYFTRDEIEQLESLTGGGPPPARPVAGAGNASEGNPGGRQNDLGTDPRP